MRVGASLVLIAIGAILKFAVTASVSGFDIGTIGVILMVVGAVGLLLSIVLMTRRQRTDVVHQHSGGVVDPQTGAVVPPTSRTTYVQPDRDPRL